MAMIADFIAPVLIGFFFVFRWGVPRGLILAVVPLLAVVAVLFFLQVSGGGPVGSPSRLQVALAYMLDDAVIWLVTFAVAATLGWAMGRTRRAA